MPLYPVREYDEPAYPTLESSDEARRVFLRRIGLAAIASALGPAAACGRLGSLSSGISSDTGNKNVKPPDQDVPPGPTRTAGVPPPPKWPGPSGALIGGGPIEVTFEGGEKGWVAVAAVFDPSDTKLEDRLIDEEASIRSMVARRLSREPVSVFKDAARRNAVEDDLIAELAKLVESKGIKSVTLAELTEEAVRGPVRKRERRQGSDAPPAPAAAPSPDAAAAPAAAPARRRLQRAGTSCPLHPEGCDASGKPGG